MATHKQYLSIDAKQLLHQKRVQEFERREDLNVRLCAGQRKRWNVGQRLPLLSLRRTNNPLDSAGITATQRQHQLNVASERVV